MAALDSLVSSSHRADAGLYVRVEFRVRGFYFAVEQASFDPSQTMKTRRLHKLTSDSYSYLLTPLEAK